MVDLTVVYKIYIILWLHNATYKKKGKNLTSSIQKSVYEYWPLYSLLESFFKALCLYKAGSTMRI